MGPLCSVRLTGAENQTTSGSSAADGLRCTGSNIGSPISRPGWVKVDYKGGEQTITIPTDATVVAFVKAPSAGELAVGRKVFVVMKKDSPEAAAVVVGADGIKPPM
jgi:hypothetical protein